MISVKADPAQDGNVITTTIYFQSPTLVDIEMNDTTFTQLVMPDCFLQALPGDPAMPAYPVSLLIPAGKQLDTVSVSYSRYIELYHDLRDKPIMPQQECVPYSFDEAEISFVMNESCYNSAEPVFEQIYSVGDVGFCRGYALTTITLYPVQYYPKTGRLFYFPSMTVTATFTDDAQAVSETPHALLRNTVRDQEVIADMVENPDDISTYDEGDEQPLGGGAPLGGDEPFDYSGGLCDPAESYHFVIITSESLASTTGYSYNWSDLIAHRASYSGLDGIIVTVEDIDACSAYWNASATFNDSQAHIREFCKDAYQDWETEYVILGGDWDATASHQIVPYRLFTDRFESETYDNMACDMYYSHLDGDWYYSADSIWGGGKSSGVNDFYGELYVGRICAYDAEMVSNAVQKIINYDTNSSLTDEWLSKVSFWGGNLGWTATSKQYMEEIRLGTDTYRTFTGFEEWNTAHPESTIDTTERLYHADIGSSYTTYFSNSVTNDNASIINHLDHSSYNTPFGMTNWQFRYNTKPFFGYSQGCLAGRFQSGYAGCEQMMCRHPERHAFALVLNTGYGYGSASSNNGASQYLQAYFWDYFFNNQSENQENWQLGKANLYAHDKMAAVMDFNSHAWCYAWYSAHYFGDPAQTLRIGNYNHPVAVSDETPSDAATDVSIDTMLLSVTLTDADGDAFDWTIETSPDIGSNSGIGASNGSKSCNISGLAYDTTYVWYVNATDGNSWTKESLSFTTESASVGNTPPYAPSNPGPSDGAGDVGITSDLSWTGGDPDAGDTVTYDVSLGTSSSPPTVVMNQSATSYDPGVLDYDITYYWKIVAWDENNTSTTSVVWSFTTEPEELPPSPPPSSPPPSSPPPSSPNELPVADAGGPYTGCISEVICFSGAGSSDLDGSIVSYNWDLGDGTIVDGQMVNHSYATSGTYLVTLLVVDNDGGEDSDTTQATATICWDYEEEPDVKNSTGEDNVSNSLSSASDTIPDELRETLGFALSNVSNITRVQFNDITYYLIAIFDEEGNSKYVFVNSVDNTKSIVQQIDEYTLLIDEDDNGVWDYQYNLKTSVCSVYSSSKELTQSQHALNINLSVVVVLSIIAALISLGVLFISHRLASSTHKSEHAAIHFYRKHSHRHFKKI